uniref:NADH-ubiquinone oxidoreductase chain 6 n=1 Tax=Clusiodes albimanus TaxID=576318 RepID=A0A7D7AHV4_9MUSC|nr:NADH dehydrogenase subunit 6 [Clusiodes albimanus]
MMQIFYFSASFMLSLIFISMNHPLAMGLMLLFQTILVSLITGMMAKTFWFSYILFLIFLGGMLVLFIYVTSLASNEMFSLSTKLMMFSIMFLMTMLFMSIIMDKTAITFSSNIQEMMPINNEYSYISENSMALNKLYNFPTNLMTLLLLNYLLITLIVIVKITNLFFGPLRMMV